MSPTQTKLESQFQAKLIQELHDTYPDAIVLKNDSSYIQGIPDLLVLIEDRWAALECKRSITEVLQPNQAYYVTEMNQMSFAAIICPENREEVLRALSASLRASR